MEKPKIALLLSGGVDSSVALHLLREQGHRPDLYYIRIAVEGEQFSECPWEEDLEMVHWLSRHYDCPLREVELHQEYQDYVLRYVLETVRSGWTPHPDLMCNKYIKFGFFHEYWGKEYDYIATGHYADKKLRNGRFYLATAADKLKDQTDFLAQLSYERLEHALFPLGPLPKEEVRAIASREGLVTAKRRDSQGICFLGKIHYNDFLREHLGELPGPIVDLQTGQQIGEHKGFWFHTIGQRKGLGLSGGPWFVIKKDIPANTLYVSRGYDPQEQYGDRICLSQMHFISGDPMEGQKEMPISFKVRHTPSFTAGLLRYQDGSYEVLSQELVQGIAPGQYCIIYDEQAELCLGCGLISAGGRQEEKIR